MKCDQCNQSFEKGETYVEFEEWIYCDEYCFLDWHRDRGLKEKVVGEDE